jgi:hypothetical protein
VPEKATIWYRGASYELGRGLHFYGIWAAGGRQAQPLEWWPETPEGWSGAWSRFTGLEPAGSIVQVGQAAAPAGRAGLPSAVAAALLAVGVACGIAGLFPGYVGGTSLADQPANLVPHVIYLAAWSASAVLILLGGARLRIGALLGLGTSIVTFGLFFADAGQAIAGGTNLAGAGLALGLAGWFTCTAGSALALWRRLAGALARPRGHELGPVVLLVLAGLGAAAAFAPSWDSYTLRTSTGLTQIVTAGNAFGYPALVITGNVAVMIALVAVVVAAALWRPSRHGAALLAGAIVPLAAQAVSAIVQLGQPPAPTLFGVSPGQASLIGLTISSGLTPDFWIYCVFVVALLLACALLLVTPGSARQVPPGPAWAGSADARTATGPQEVPGAVTMPAPMARAGQVRGPAGPAADPARPDGGAG